jgi:hypothetical protein
MKPNRLHIILKIFGFLIFSIGILYICQFFTHALEEGFQVNTPPSQAAIKNITDAGCTTTYDSGRNIILCPDSNAANTIFGNMAVNLAGTYDNVCITNRAFLSNYYTCYTRPAQPVYTHLSGISRPFHPEIHNDTLASHLLPSIDTMCASYNTTTLKINKGLASTQAVYTTVSTTLHSTTVYTTSINSLINNYCGPTNQNMGVQCSNLRTAYTYISGIPTTTGLVQARDAVKASLDSLSNMSTTNYSIYNGSKCNTLSAYALSNI